MSLATKSLQAGRAITSWQGTNFPHPLNKIILHTSDTVRSELIGSLNLYAEVKQIAKELLKKHGHRDLSDAFLRFQAYIRQARTFFEAAEALPPRASPLNYYYAFMNFAKAYIFLCNPTFVDKNLTHGLTTSPTSINLRKQKILVKGNGVFPLFYRQITGTHLASKSSLKLVDMFGYSSDVGYEYEHLRYGRRASFKTKFAIGVNANTKMAFPIIAVLGTLGRDFDRIRVKLTKTFDQVNLHERYAQKIFNIVNPERQHCEFFESKKEYPVTASDIVPDVISNMRGLVSYSPFYDDVLLVLNKPIRAPKLAAMNEVLAIYCCMFFLGSLVRYKPDLLEKMLSTKDAWLIERFTKSVPLTFLRHLRNLIDGQYQAYAVR
jgi:hypothetical protein